MRVILKRDWLAPNHSKYNRSQNRRDWRAIPDQYRDQLPSTAEVAVPGEAFPETEPTEVSGETGEVPLETAAAADFANAEDEAERLRQASAFRSQDPSRPTGTLKLKN